MYVNVQFINSVTKSSLTVNKSIKIYGVTPSGAKTQVTSVSTSAVYYTYSLPNTYSYALISVAASGYESIVEWDIALVSSGAVQYRMIIPMSPTWTTSSKTFQTYNWTSYTWNSTSVLESFSIKTIKWDLNSDKYRINYQTSTYGASMLGIYLGTMRMFFNGPVYQDLLQGNGIDSVYNCDYVIYNSDSGYIDISESEMNDDYFIIIIALNDGGNNCVFNFTPYAANDFFFHKADSSLASYTISNPYNNNTIYSGSFGTNYTCVVMPKDKLFNIRGTGPGGPSEYYTYLYSSNYRNGSPSFMISRPQNTSMGTWMTDSNGFKITPFWIYDYNTWNAGKFYTSSILNWDANWDNCSVAIQLQSGEGSMICALNPNASDYAQTILEVKELWEDGGWPSDLLLDSYLSGTNCFIGGYALGGAGSISINKNLISDVVILYVVTRDGETLVEGTYQAKYKILVTNTDRLQYKNGSSWTPVKNAWIKQNGIWVQNKNQDAVSTYLQMHGPIFKK